MNRTIFDIYQLNYDGQWSSRTDIRWTDSILGYQGLVAWPKIVPNPDPEPQFDLNLVQVITKAI